jgi:hypothetical protein
MGSEDPSLLLYTLRYVRLTEVDTVDKVRAKKKTYF